ncbi:MAG: hypothetical protein HY691_19785, partial [Chloroflexi bacterium]|nr:hypothetical protein [Chloroflexota bacterium]
MRGLWDARNSLRRRLLVFVLWSLTALGLVGCLAEERTVYVAGVAQQAESAQFGGRWSTGIQVFNQDDAQPNLGTVRFYRVDGTEVATESVTIPANGSATLFGPTLPVPLEFAGSATVRAQRPVKVIANALVSGAGAASSYGGWAVPAKTIYAPRLWRAGDAGSVIQIVNATALPVKRVAISFRGYDPQAATDVWSNNAPVPPRGSLEVVLSSRSRLGVSEWLGSATISADENIVVVVHEGRPGQLASYN